MEKQITANLFDVGCISIFGANGAESRWDSFSTDRSGAQTWEHEVRNDPFHGWKAIKQTGGTE